jgi:hypothetical protein
MNLEDDLRRALRRKPAPAALTGRVLDGVARAKSDRPKARAVTMRRAVFQWLAAAAAVGAIAVGVPRYYAQQRAVEAERATREVMHALAITSEKLALVQQRLHDTSR